MNETKKMMEIIHQNCKKEQGKRAISKMENKKNLKIRAFEIVCLIVAILTIAVCYCRYNEKQIKNCMELGGSENFCRYAGE